MKPSERPFVTKSGRDIRGMLVFFAWVFVLPGFADITVTSSRAWATASASASWYNGITRHDLGQNNWFFDEPSGGGGGWASKTGKSGHTHPDANGTAVGLGGAVVSVERTLAADRKSAFFALFGGGIASAYIFEGDPPHANDPVANAGGQLRACHIHFTLERAATFLLNGGFTAGKRSSGGSGAGGITLSGPSGLVARYYVSASGSFVKNDPTVTTLAPGNYQLGISGSGAATGESDSGEYRAGGAGVTLYLEEIPAASAQDESEAASPRILTSTTDVQEIADVSQAFATWFPTESGTFDLQVDGGSPTLTFPVRSGLSYAIDWSDDLNTWHRDQIRLAQEGDTEETFIDSTTDEFTTRRFYRVTPYFPIMPGDDDLIQP